jgi:hypothetical protein
MQAVDNTPDKTKTELYPGGFSRKDKAPLGKGNKFSANVFKSFLPGFFKLFLNIF